MEENKFETIYFLRLYHKPCNNIIKIGYTTLEKSIYPMYPLSWQYLLTF